MHLSSRRVTARLVAACAILLAGCSDVSGIAGPASSPLQRATSSAALAEDIRGAIAAQERHTEALMRRPGVLGTAVGLLPNGRAAIRVFVLDATPREIPAALDNVPVEVRVTGRLVAHSDPTMRLRPAPVGFSVGHPLITAGTIGARVVNASGQLFALSNNHVLAASNDASIGDPMLQPGPFDGGTSADRIGTLAAFRSIDFSGASNVMDAAIALSDATMLGNATPIDDGYGVPGTRIFGDANSDRLFDDRTQLLNLNVMKYGRTTKLTRGRITGINATVDICYEVLIIICVKSARFTDQIVIGQSGFSDGGDSGSLIVVDNVDRNPVALLFAGSTTETIANRIDLVLNHFDVSIDGSASEPPPPPDPVADARMVGINAQSSIEEGRTVFVGAVVRNDGNQPIGSFNITMVDQTDGTTIGTANVASLAVGVTHSVTFSWNTTGKSIGSHVLVASHDLVDGNTANNTVSRTIQITAPAPAPDPELIHVGDLDGSSQRSGNGWSASVNIRVHDAAHASLNGATVVGQWSVGGLASDTCTTGELGGVGTCTVLHPSLKRSTRNVRFTVTSVTIAGRTYAATQNHDPDGSSNGTSQTVNRP
jgi:hypothetical protein